MTDAKVDYLPGLSKQEKIAKLQSMSYRDYLLNTVKAHPDVIPFTNGVWCMGPDAVSAWFAFYRYKPGFAGLGIERPPGAPESPEHMADDFELPAGILSFPATPRVYSRLAAGSYQEIETARVDYSKLDQPGNLSRLRLGSTVIRARHIGTLPHQFEPDKREVEVTYVTSGKAYSVRAKDVVMAGFNNMIPYICPELPSEQKAALHKAVRAVNQQTNVLLRNWEPFAKTEDQRHRLSGRFLRTRSRWGRELRGRRTK